jgi:hypothetical protein
MKNWKNALRDAIFMVLGIVIGALWIAFSVAATSIEVKNKNGFGVFMAKPGNYMCFKADYN